MQKRLEKGPKKIETGEDLFENLFVLKLTDEELYTLEVLLTEAKSLTTRYIRDRYLVNFFDYDLRCYFNFIRRAAAGSAESTKNFDKWPAWQDYKKELEGRKELSWTGYIKKIQKYFKKYRIIQPSYETIDRILNSFMAIRIVDSDRKMQGRKEIEMWHLTPEFYQTWYKKQKEFRENPIENKRIKIFFGEDRFENMNRATLIEESKVGHPFKTMVTRYGQ